MCPLGTVFLLPPGWCLHSAWACHRCLQLYYILGFKKNPHVQIQGGGGGPLQKEAFEKTALHSVIRGIYIQLTKFFGEISLFFNTLNGDTQYISRFLFLVGIQAKENESLLQIV